MVERARRFAHALFIRRLWQVTSFTVSRRPLKRMLHPLARNIRLQVTDAEELMQAADLRKFADWVLREDGEDYLEDVVDAPSPT